MTNAEKYLKDEVDIKEIANGINEAYITCYDEEDLVDCVYRWFETEAKYTLTEDERVILRNIREKENKYITRDKSGYLYITEKPFSMLALPFSIYNHLFQFIKNGEEYEIAELLKG